MQQWGVSHWDIECETTQYSRFGLSDEQRNVLVWYVHPSTGEEKRLQTAEGSRPSDNLRAIYLTLDSIRLAEYRGLGDLMKQNYTLLAEKATRRAWHVVLGVNPEASLEECERAYREVAKVAHPDVPGGDEQWMRDVNAAIAEARAR